MNSQTFFRRTTRAKARAILSEGFRDQTGTYLTGQEQTGVRREALERMQASLKSAPAANVTTIQEARDAQQ